MAQCSSHLAAASGGAGGGHHGAPQLQLLHSAGGDLAGSEEEEDGPLPDVTERQKRLHPSDKVCAGQRKQLRVAEEFAENHPGLYDTAVRLFD